MKKLDWVFSHPLFVPVVYKWLKSCAKKAHFPYPIEILFLNLCGSSVSHLFFWYLYRLWPIATSKTSSLTEWIPLRTILLYQRSFFIIPKVPSACIERFIRNNAPWILSRFSILSDRKNESGGCIRTVPADECPAGLRNPENNQKKNACIPCLSPQAVT